MNKYLLLFTIPFIFSCSNRIKYSDNFVDLSNSKVSIEASKTNIIIVLSTQSCHNCYLQVQEQLSKNSLYSDTNKVIGVVVIDDEDNIKSAPIRKSYYNLAKEYFPELKKIYFSGSVKRKYANLFGKKINVRGVPIIILIQDNRAYFYQYDDLDFWKNII